MRTLFYRYGRIMRWDKWMKTPTTLWLTLCVEVIMHNLVSYNQLAEWKHFEQTVDQCNDELDLINDYFNCLIECDEDQQTCKRICRNMLND